MFVFNFGVKVKIILDAARDNNKFHFVAVWLPAACFCCSTVIMKKVSHFHFIIEKLQLLVNDQKLPEGPNRIG